MSNVVSAIMAKDTGERRIVDKSRSALFQDVFQVKEEVYEGAGHTIAKIYRIGVTLGAQAQIVDDPSYRPGTPLEDAVTRTKMQVVEAVFGEFRPFFRQIERALYNFQYEEAARLLGEMEQQMFGVK